jgi:hypothetical protein
MPWALSESVFSWRPSPYFVACSVGRFVGRPLQPSNAPFFTTLRGTSGGPGPIGNWRRVGSSGRLLKFNISNGLISIVGNLALMELLAVRLHFNYMLSNLAAIGVLSLLNFFVSDKLVFK